MGLTWPIYCGLDSTQPRGLGWCSSPKKNNCWLLCNPLYIISWLLCAQ
jgi:hypothetical protein